jgi:hypothetical protein
VSVNRSTLRSKAFGWLHVDVRTLISSDELCRDIYSL